MSMKEEEDLGLSNECRTSSARFFKEGDVSGDSTHPKEM
jgi:hypothetical protein